MPSKIFTVGQIAGIGTVHVPHLGKVTFADIVEQENQHVLYRYRYQSAKFRKYAQHIEIGTLVAVEGSIATDTSLKPPDGARSTILVDGESFRVLQRPPAKKLSLDETIPAWTIGDDFD